MTSTPNATRRRAGRRAITLLLGAALAAAALAGCGGGGDAPRVSGSGSGTGTGQASSGGMEMRMRDLGSATSGDFRADLTAMGPVTFQVSQGDRFVEQRPERGDNAHFMILLSDARSRDRLPDATITLRVRDESGRVVSSGPQYPMIGMGMGIHYGDNVRLPGPGRYEAELVVGPPRIGRHEDVVGRWRTTTRMRIPFRWDGAR